jgi:hypothetical protein
MVTPAARREAPLTSGGSTVLGFGGQMALKSAADGAIAIIAQIFNPLTISGIAEARCFGPLGLMLLRASPALARSQDDARKREGRAAAHLLRSALGREKAKQIQKAAPKHRLRRQLRQAAR